MEIQWPARERKGKGRKRAKESGSHQRTKGQCQDGEGKRGERGGARERMGNEVSQYNTLQYRDVHPNLDGNPIAHGRARFSRTRTRVGFQIYSFQRFILVITGF